MKFKSTAALALLLIASPAFAAIKMPAIFGNNMVVQQKVPLPVWGWADPGETVTVTLSDAANPKGQSAQAKANDKGEWRIHLKPIKAGPSYTLAVHGSSDLQFTGVEAGEVWFCSGQSNMHWTFDPAHQVDNNEAERLAANYPKIRFFTTQKSGAPAPAPNAVGKWLVCSPESLKEGGGSGMSALAYFFGRQLHQELKVPIGLVNSSVGGTPIEAWSPGGNLYNAMVHPIAPFPVRGFLWYQGESNVLQKDGMKYLDRQKGMIEAWRKLWGSELPFYFVHLAPFRYGGLKLDAEELPKLWEAQTATLQLPRTGMAVITDTVTNLADIHPRNKQEAARRLALIALARDYGKKIPFSGPLFKSAEPQGRRIVVKFDHADGGLASRDGKPLDWFQVAGRDKKFVEAQAEIRGVSVEVSSDAVPQPQYVRFGWNEIAQPNLVNKVGLPAAPFRTDR